MNQATPVEARSGVRGNPWWTLVATALGVIMVALDGTVVAIANPFIAKDLDASLADLQWVTNAYLLALAVLLIPAGKFGDRYGRRQAFLIGVTGFALTSLAVGLSGTIGMVIVFRVLQGVFGALIMPNTLALLRSAFPPEKLNSAVGIWGAATAASTAGGPILAGVLVEQINWESVFYINIPVGALALLVGLLVLRESRDTGRSRIDLIGVLLLGGGLFLLIFGVIKAQSWGWADQRTLGFIGAGLLVLVVFIVAETRIRQPLLPMALFRDRSVSIGSLTVLLNFFALFGVLFFISLYLQNVHGYSAVGAGVRTLPLTVLFVLSSPLSGWLTGRFGPRLPITAGLLVVTASMVALLALDTDSSYLLLWPPMVGLGLGIGLVVVASTEAIVGNTPLELAGVAGGVQSTFMQLGGVLGSAVLGSVLASRVGSVLVEHLGSAGVPHRAAVAFRDGAKEFVSQGLAPIPPRTPPGLEAAITDGSHAAFMSGLHVALLVAGAISLVGALLAPFIRRGHTPTGDVAIARPEPMQAAPPAVEPVEPVEKVHLGQTTVQSGHGPVRGRITRRGGNPAGAVAVTLIDGGGRQIGRQLTDDAGRYELAVAAPGDYVLVVRARAHQPQATPLHVDGVPVRHDVRLRASGSVAGTVRTAAGAVPAAAAVTLTDQHGEVLETRAVTADGRFWIDEVGPGDYTVVASAAGLAPVAATATVSDADPARLQLRLTGGGTLRGTVRTPAAGPVPDARVSLLDRAGATVARARSDEHGAFTFSGLCLGDYTLVAASYPPASDVVRLGPGDQRRHDIVLSYPD